MPKWIKWAAFGALVTIPTVGYVVTRYRAHSECPVSPGQPCDRK